ncbi:MAG: RNA polymerase sporulation sigma factor SigG [Firmicutes bacterium]|nr:RNA polymerase sporulation sigma factor SigG [Bacillota bacterium]
MLPRKVQISGVNTYKLPVINNKKMIELLRDLKDGDESARQKLIEGNLRLVLSILQRFKNRGESLDDLFQVGCIGLMKAIDNFELEQKVNFSTYAVPMIIGEIKRYLRDNNNSIHISRSIKNLAHRIQQTREMLTKDHLREVTLKEIAAELDITVEEAVFALNSCHDPLSLHDPVFNDSTDPVYIMDLISDQCQTAENWIENIAIKEALDKLPPREKEILEARFFEGKTQLEIAGEIGISQAQVSRLEKAALKFLRHRYYQEQKEQKKREEGGV